MKFMLATVILVGCAAPDEVPAPPIHAYCTEPQIAGGVTTHETCVHQPEQGRSILGITADGLRTASSHIAAVSPGLTVDATMRELRVGGAAVTGTVELMTNNTRYLFQITGPGPGYTVSYRDLQVQASTWQPLCTSPEEVAYAIEGTWSVAGNHVATPNAVTFSCITRGKAAWCEDLGYVPTTSLGWDLHQACVEMATANYCNDGLSHTREKTPVEIRDSAGIQLPNLTPNELTRFPTPMPVVPPAPSEFFLEGIWQPNRPVLCLSKFRWAEMPENPCPAQLPDPRLGTGGAYCEDIHLDTVRPPYLLNGSRVMDVAIHRWGNAGNTDSITSVNGVDYDPQLSHPTGYPNRLRPPDRDHRGVHAAQLDR
jgi:hypothetical protein